MKPTNSPTQGQPNPRRKRFKVALGPLFPTASNFSWVGTDFISETDWKKPNLTKFSANTLIYPGMVLGSVVGPEYCDPPCCNRRLTRCPFSFFSDAIIIHGGPTKGYNWRDSKESAIEKNSHKPSWHNKATNSVLLRFTPTHQKPSLCCHTAASLEDNEHFYTSNIRYTYDKKYVLETVFRALHDTSRTRYRHACNHHARHFLRQVLHSNKSLGWGALEVAINI